MKPVICNYYITCRCNARCSFCSIWRSPEARAEAESPPETVCRNLDDLRRLGVRIVDFTGGEPLLYHGLPVILARAKRLGLRTTVTTNGILYTSRAREIAGLVDFLQFSLEGPDRESHDAVTKTPSFDRVIEGIETAHSLGERPTVCHTVTDDSIDRVPDVVALCRRLGALLFLNPCFSYFGNGGLSPSNVSRLYSMAKGRGVAVDRGYLRFLIDGGNRAASPRCYAVSSCVVISPDDRLVVPCWHHAVKTIPIDGRLIETRESPEVRAAIEREGRYPFCEGCAINCYYRASVLRRFDLYSMLSVLSGVKYLWEYRRM